MIDAFRGLRVGMALHTATTNQTVNKFDGGKETLQVETVIFDATYKGTAVQLCKELCLKSYGGELLASKAVSEALLRSKKGGDEISIQRLGIMKFANIRHVELVELTPRDLPTRKFPPRSFVTKMSKHPQKNQRQSRISDILDDEKETTPNYDPFPSTNRRVEDIEEEDEEEEEEDDENYATMNEKETDEDEEEEDDEDDDESEHGNNSHSSIDHDNQHNPPISRPERRPSITQLDHYTIDQQTKIEVSFDAKDDEKIMNGISSMIEEPEPDDGYRRNQDLLRPGYNQKQHVVEDIHSDHSIDPPKGHTSRNKKAEIDDYRRKSLAQNSNMEMNVLQFREQQHRDTDQQNLYDDTKEEEKKRKQRDPSKRKRRKKPRKKRNIARRKFVRSGQDGDDENSPQPGDSDYEEVNNTIAKPKRLPRVDKKAQYQATMVDINFDPHMDDSSVYSNGSRSFRTSRTDRSNKLLDPTKQLKLYKVRPNNLPNDYSDDKDYTCLNCQKNKKWTDGVWRVPMWPSFDVCVECANNELHTGTSKRMIAHLDPTGINSYVNNMYNPIHLQPDHGFGDLSGSANLPPSHKKVPSNQPILKEYDDMYSGVGNNNKHKMNQEALEMLRRELSSIIELLANERMQRLDNLAKWAEGEQEFAEFRQKTIDEHKATEKELDEWRKKANRLDEQDQRVLRRKNTINLESPTASDLGSDEELHNNWQDYDYGEDFAAIHTKLKQLDDLFWTEDQFYKKKFETSKIFHANRVKQLQQQYGQTTMELQQANEELQRKIDEFGTGKIIDRNSKKYEDILNNGDDIDDYSSDDLKNQDMVKIQKYVPPRVKHIHDSSRQLVGIDPSQLNAPNRDNEEYNDYNHNNEYNNNNDNEYNTNSQQLRENTRLKEEVSQLNGTVDNYISTINRQRAEKEELIKKVNYVCHI